MDHLLAMDPRPDVLVRHRRRGRPRARPRSTPRRGPGSTAGPARSRSARATTTCATRSSRASGSRRGSVVEAGGYRFVMLDSLIDAVAGERVDEGRLGEDQLAWLDARLGESDAPGVRLPPPPADHDRARADGPDPADRRRRAGGRDRPPPARRRDAGRPRPHDGRHDVRRPAAADRRRRRLHRHRGRRGRSPTVWYDAPPSLALHLVDDDRPGHHPLAAPCPAQ